MHCCLNWERNVINVWISLYIDLQWLLPIYHDNNIDEWEQTVVVVFSDKQSKGLFLWQSPDIVLGQQS